MKTLIITICLLGATCLVVHGQQKKSVVIGTMVSRPNAVLVLNPPNSDQGFLLPQLDTKQREAILPSSPVDDGLMVYDISEKSFYHWNEGAWIKGLGTGAASQLLNYDANTQRLTLSGGNFVDLSTLKEIPTQTANAGKFLTTNGTTLSWATLSALGDITGIITGATSGLSGGATAGDATLTVNTDNTTISINGTNQLQLSNGAVTTAKIANNTINSTHIIDGTVGSADILDNTISTVDLANGSVTGAKIGTGEVAVSNIASGGNSKVLTTTAAGAVFWEDKVTVVDDNQNLTLAANALGIDGGTGVNLSTLTTSGDVAGQLGNQTIQTGTVNSVKILDGSVATVDLANGSVTGTKIGANEVATGNIASGGNDKILTTTATGIVTWDNKSALIDDNQNLTLVGNALGIDGGVGVNLDNLATGGDVTGPISNQTIQGGAVNSAKILDGSVATVDLANGSVTGPKIGVGQVGTTNIASGGNDRVLTTDGAGVVNWSNISTFVGDNQNLSLAANLLGIDNGASVDLNLVSTLGDVSGPLSAQVIQPGAVNSAKILDGSIANTDLANGSVTSIKIGAGAVIPSNIASGGNSKVLTTNPSGTVIWDDIANVGSDNQNLVLNSNLLSIDNGTGADLNNLLITGEVQGNLNNAIIQPNTITSAKILNGTILPADLAPGTANQVMVTNPTATAAQWVTPGGDVTGTIGASTVAAIQGRNVAATAPGVGDILVWNGTAWTPQNVTVTPTTQYLALDPSNFVGVENTPSDDKGKLGLFDGTDSRFVFARGNARQIMAAVNLPHGAVIQQVTAYYNYGLLLGPLNIVLQRKPLTGGALDPLGSMSPLLALGDGNQSFVPGTGATVDNSVYSYRVIVTFPNLADVTDPASALIKLYAIRVTYSK